MPDRFDPFAVWLQIPPDQRPLTYYSLLGLDPFSEGDEIILEAVRRQVARVKSMCRPDQMDIGRRILGELQRAKSCLLNPESKSKYDERLRSQRAGSAHSPAAKAETLGETLNRPQKSTPNQAHTTIAKGSKAPVPPSRTVSSAADEFRLSDVGERFHTEAAEKLAKFTQSTESAPPVPAKYNLLVSGLLYPWHPQILLVWLSLSVGLIIASYMWLFLWGPAARVGLAAVRALGPSTGLFTVFVLSYATIMCLTIVHETAAGSKKIEDWPGFDWQEWAWTYLGLVVLMMQSALAGLLAKIFPPHSSLAMVGFTMIAFPVVVLSSMESQAMVAPYSRDIWRSLWTNARDWLTFFVLTEALILGWCYGMMQGLAINPWGSVLATAPALAAIILIYARLLGRLAWCIANKTTR